MICDNCGRKTARARRTTRSYGSGKTAFLVEGVPVVTCGSCGETYLTAPTLKELERIKRHWRKLAVKRVVRVARFDGAA
jgi:YgiT-type zinc finger domain-containing protein